jgi:hypothetical protein
VQRGAQAERTGPDDHDISVHQASVPLFTADVPWQNDRNPDVSAHARHSAAPGRLNGSPACATGQADLGVASRGHRAVFTASGTINREDWGLTWNMPIDGGLLVSKEIRIEIDL